ncbi:hypothetical protein KKD57_01970 [Patescibacteria group bacterium]|nr:hypothetical protein [Patescibacteria group bacterium]
MINNNNINIKDSFIQYGIMIIYAMVIFAIIGFLIVANYEFSHNNPTTAAIAFFAAMVVIASCIWAKIRSRKK